MPIQQVQAQPAGVAQQQAIPSYIIKPNIYRSIIPKSAIVLCLCIILYLLVYINFALINRYVPESFRTILMIIILLVIIIQSLMSYKSFLDTDYSFFADRIRLNNQEKADIMFSSIASARKEEGFFDKFFGTGSIIIDAGKRYKIINISNVTACLQYIQKMTSRSSSNKLYK